MAPLFQADDNLFLNLDLLNLVSFDGTGEQTRAHLKFKDGGSETVSGESASNLRIGLKSLGTKERSTPSRVEHDTSQQTAPIDVSGTPLVGRNKAWFYTKNNGSRGLILAFVNAKGSCSLRPFDSDTGVAHQKRYGSGPYQREFADLLAGAFELTVESQPNLERDCKLRLPERLLSQLRQQIENIAENQKESK